MNPKLLIPANEQRDRESRLNVLFTVSVLGLFLAGSVAWWVVSSRLESSAYNRLTGAETTTWDAMFLDLRVMDSPKR